MLVPGEVPLLPLVHVATSLVNLPWNGKSVVELLKGALVVTHKLLLVVALVIHPIVEKRQDRNPCTLADSLLAHQDRVVHVVVPVPLEDPTSVEHMTVPCEGWDLEVLGKLCQIILDPRPQLDVLGRSDDLEEEQELVAQLIEGDPLENLVHVDVHTCTTEGLKNDPIRESTGITLQVECCHEGSIHVPHEPLAHRIKIPDLEDLLEQELVWSVLVGVSARLVMTLVPEKIREGESRIVQLIQLFELGPQCCPQHVWRFGRLGGCHLEFLQDTDIVNLCLQNSQKSFNVSLFLFRLAVFTYT